VNLLKAEGYDMTLSVCHYPPWPLMVIT